MEKICYQNKAFWNQLAHHTEAEALEQIRLYHSHLLQEEPLNIENIFCTLIKIHRAHHILDFLLKNRFIIHIDHKLRLDVAQKLESIKLFFQETANFDRILPLCGSLPLKNQHLAQIFARARHETRAVLQESYKKYYQRMSRMIENWSCFVSREDSWSLNPRLHQILSQNFSQYAACLHQKFNGVLPSSLAISLDSAVVQVVLKYGTRSMRVKTIAGLQHLFSIDLKRHYDSSINIELQHILETRHSLSEKHGYISFLEYQQLSQRLITEPRRLKKIYQELLTITQPLIETLIERLKDFAKTHDNIQDFETADIFYYLYLTQTNNSLTPSDNIFSIIHIINTLSTHLQSHWGLRIIIAPDMTPGACRLDLSIEKNDRAIGHIILDMTHKAAQKNFDDYKPQHLLLDSIAELPTLYIPFMGSDKTRLCLCFDEIENFCTSIAWALADLLCYHNTHYLIECRNGGITTRSFIHALFNYWIFNDHFLSSMAVTIQNNIIMQWLDYHKAQQIIQLHQLIQIGYFDCLVHSTSFYNLFKNNPQEYHPAALWEQIETIYNPVALPATPLLHNTLYQEDLLIHQRLLGLFLASHAQAALRADPSKSALLYECLFEENLENPNLLTIETHFCDSKITEAAIISELLSIEKNSFFLPSQSTQEGAATLRPSQK